MVLLPLYILQGVRMNTRKRQAKVTFTLKPSLLKELKEYLEKDSKTNDYKYVSQSEFISVAISDLLKKETTNG